MNSWRDKSRPIIEKVIADVGRSDEKKLRAALRDAYPFGPRQYHPYRIWCDEINRQLGKKPKVRRGERIDEIQLSLESAGQMRLI